MIADQHEVEYLNQACSEDHTHCTTLEVLQIYQETSARYPSKEKIDAFAGRNVSKGNAFWIKVVFSHDKKIEPSRYGWSGTLLA